MPELHPEKVVSFSSEDKSYPASNLLTPSGFKKWKCERAGEKTITVEFQLSKAEKISQIDIGNEGSAFVEVLVRRSSGPADNYQCLLVSSSFMSPLDARSRTGLNRVRMFKSDKLTKTVAEQKWDRIRVVCSQPFSRTEQYGLSFIRFYSSETDASNSADDGDTGAKTKKQGTIGGFFIRDDKDDDDENGGTLFNKVKDGKTKSPSESPKAGPSSMASQIRAATKVAEEAVSKKKAESPAAIQKKRSSEDDEEASSSQPAAKRPKQNAPSEKPKATERKEDKKPAVSRSASSSSEEASSQLNTIMQGVVFVLSGYQNPLRARLRDMATDMGATYKGNWGPGCTHLICAFVATPKYKEVSGKGYIVTDKWILECHKRRRLLPWRDYRLGRAPSPPGADNGGKRGRRARPGTMAMKDSDDDDEEDDDEEDEEVLPKKNRKSPPKRVRAGDDESNESDDGSDSEEELRRKKRTRLKKNR